MELERDENKKVEENKVSESINVFSTLSFPVEKGVEKKWGG